MKPVALKATTLLLWDQAIRVARRRTRDFGVFGSAHRDGARPIRPK
jgi:hypothetical protein